MDLRTTPFETQMLRDAQTFVGRWSELQLLITAVDQRRPAIAIAAPQSGRSSLLFHAVAAGAVLLDYDDLPAFYLDMAEFPDLVAVQDTIAEAFAPPGISWQQAILRSGTAPLLAFDNIDAPQFADVRSDWQALLAAEVRAGRLRVIAAAADLDAAVTDWQRVDLAPVGQSFLSEYLDVTLPDGPHPNRAEQQFIVTVARGHLGTMIIALTLWYQSLQQPELAWQTIAERIRVEDAGKPPLLIHSSTPLDAAAHQPPSAERTQTAHTTLREHERTVDRSVVGISGWVVVIAFGVLLLVWVLGGI